MTKVKIEKEALKFLSTTFGIDEKLLLEKEKHSVLCPFHDDSTKSGMLSIYSNRFFCFVSSCGKSVTIKRLINDLRVSTDNNNSEIDTDKDKKENKVKPVIEKDDLIKYAKIFFQNRGIKQQWYDFFNAEIIFDSNDPFYGYVIFQQDKCCYSRCFLPDSFKFLKHDTRGSKTLFGKYHIDKTLDYVILVESVLDVLAMYAMGFKNIIAIMGSHIEYNGCYELKKLSEKHKMHVFIMLDNDASGFLGAKKVKENLDIFSVPCTILDYRQVVSETTKDPNDILLNEKDSILFKEWLNKKLSIKKVTENIRDIFKHSEELITYPSGYAVIDKLLNGGYCAGTHGIIANTGMGKSCFSLTIANNIANCIVNNKLDKKILYVTTEISVRQCWSRIASRYSINNWALIEKNPLIVEDNVIDYLESIEDNLKILSQKSPNKILDYIEHYDIIFVDYLQDLEYFSSNNNNETAQINKFVRYISHRSNNEGKLVFLVSSIPNSERYSKNPTVKGSGDVNYKVASMLAIRKKFGSLELEFTKNTRGETGENSKFIVTPDFPHCMFKEAYMVEENFMENGDKE